MLNNKGGYNYIQGGLSFSNYEGLGIMKRPIMSNAKANHDYRRSLKAYSEKYQGLSSVLRMALWGSLVARSITLTSRSWEEIL